MRLDKYLAYAGFGTRKEVKKMIRGKRVEVNGKICIKDDMHIDEQNDQVRVDDMDVTYTSQVYIMLNKPQGVISATQDAMHETVLDCIEDILPKDVFPVGRLDIDTEGLLLICNDGKLAHSLLAPKKHVSKRYYIELDHSISDEDINELKEGITIDEDLCVPGKITRIADDCIEMEIFEGKYHQVKRMMHAIRNEVVYLKRVQMGDLVLDETLEPGEYRYLSDEEIELLKGN